MNNTDHTHVAGLTVYVGNGFYLVQCKICGDFYSTDKDD